MGSVKYPQIPWGNLVDERNEQVDSPILPPLSVGKKGVTPQLDNIAKAKDKSSRKIVRKGDLVINSRSDRRGASGLSSLNGTVSVVYCVMTPRNEVLDPNFAHHLLRSSWFQEEFFRYGTGIVADLWSTRFERMRQIRVPLPKLNVQRAIADYLDQETSEIDAMLEKLEGLSQLLEERRLATVRNTVYGENPDLRSSEEWRSSKLSHVVTFKNGRDFKSTESITDNIPVYGSGGVFAHTKEWLYDGESVLFGRKGTVDRPLYVTGKFWTVDTMYYTIPGPHVVAKYIYYWATTAPYSVISTQTAVPSTTSGDLGRLMLPLPPLNEQAHIVTHLNKATAQIDAMLAKVQELKDLLVERRSALITAAVTGQIEVN